MSSQAPKNSFVDFLASELMLGTCSLLCISINSLPLLQPTIALLPTLSLLLIMTQGASPESSLCFPHWWSCLDHSAPSWHSELHGISNCQGKAVSPQLPLSMYKIQPVRTHCNFVLQNWGLKKEGGGKTYVMMKVSQGFLLFCQ